MPELKSDAIARLPGQQPPTIQKHHLDHRVYVVDCAPLLRENELAVNARAVSSPGLTVEQVRTRYGRYLQMNVSGGEIEKSPQDLTATFAVETSDGQFVVQVAFRIYK